MDDSPLGRLLPEVRNMVYKYAFRLPETTNVDCNYNRTRWAYRSLSAANDPLALTKTCKAIKDESRVIFFAINIFTFTSCGSPVVPAESLDCLTKWSDTIGQDATQALTSITLKIGNGFSSLMKSDAGFDELCRPFLTFQLWSDLHSRCAINAEVSLAFEREPLRLNLKHTRAPWEQAFALARTYDNDARVPFEHRHIEGSLKKLEELLDTKTTA